MVSTITAQQQPAITLIGAAPFVLIPLAAAITGYSEKAIRRKIEEGIWIEGREWIKAPDGHVMISIRGYEKWVLSR